MSSDIFISLSLRALFNFGVCYTTVRYIYSATSNNREFMFAMYTFNVVIFALCTLLKDVTLELGAGFGLFALFGLLNYRTEVMKTKDMTYLLVVIAFGFINGLYKDGTDMTQTLEVILLNLLIMATIYLLEKKLLQNFTNITKVRYEKIENIQPERRAELLADLHERTGLNITDVSVDNINYLNDTAQITIYYR